MITPSAVAVMLGLAQALMKRNKTGGGLFSWPFLELKNRELKVLNFI
jgi:hypothetical protein